MKVFITVVFIFLVFISVQAQQNDSLKNDSLAKIIEQELQNQNTIEPVRSSPSTNPNIGVIGDFQGSYLSNATRNYNAYINEAEFSFQSEIDPYARADFFYSVGRTETGGFESGIEEGYLTTLSLPAHLQLKVGKFKSALGRINPVHAHALAFISLPSAYENYFGEGINDEGLQLNWLVPNSAFYQLLTVQLTDGPLDCPSFSRSKTNQYLSLAHLKNFFDINDNSTLEIGFSGIYGANDSNLVTTVAAGDLTYKWKPIRFNTYKSFTLQSEVFFSNKQLKIDSTIHSVGWYAMMNFQFAKRWFFTGIYSYSNLPNDAQYVQQSYSGTIGWYATEFQKIELEGKTVTSNSEKQYYQALLRWIFVIGAHGAHQY